jgi:biotin-dependent carboxylase-like uncharacterized protein
VLTVVEAGWATTLQDAGRRGYAHLGVPGAGAVDRGLAALVNRLVGNPESAAVLETAGGLVLRADTPVVIATSIHLAPVTLVAGAAVDVAPDADRTWAYVAVRGGVVAAGVLGSCSTDTLSGLGPPPVRRGQRIEVGPEPGTPIVADLAPVAAGRAAARVWPGPRLDWFVPDALEVLCADPWTVAQAVSRVGMRLDGAALRRIVERELPSEGLVEGAVQVTHDGRPVVMLADHPTTGGYPVLAVVDPADLARVAQARPGTSVRFVLAT